MFLTETFIVFYNGRVKHGSERLNTETGGNQMWRITSYSE